MKLHVAACNDADPHRAANALMKAESAAHFNRLPGKADEKMVSSLTSISKDIQAASATAAGRRWNGRSGTSRKFRPAIAASFLVVLKAAFAARPKLSTLAGSFRASEADVTFSEARRICCLAAPLSGGFDHVRRRAAAHDRGVLVSGASACCYCGSQQLIIDIGIAPNDERASLLSHIEQRRLSIGARLQHVRGTLFARARSRTHHIEENGMQAPTWLQPAITGAIVGGIATMIIGFNFGGWYLGSSAETLAQKQSTAAVVAALVPICIDQSQTDPEGVTKLKDFGAIKSSYEQRNFVMKAGWATMPTMEAPDQALASACAEVLAKPAGS